MERKSPKIKTGELIIEAKNFFDFANSEVNPTRNIDCFYYLECLGVAAKKDLNNLGCFKCDCRDNKSYIMNEPDFRGLIELYKYVKENYIELNVSVDLEISERFDLGISERFGLYEVRRFFANRNF